jgi:ElaB/YqjD/DUF883 family membrane-anchored ribosome-binding protein
VRSAVGGWLSAVGCRRLVVGGWLRVQGATPWSSCDSGFVGGCTRNQHARATDDIVDVVRQRFGRSLRTQLLRVQRATSRTSHDSGVVVGCTRNSLHAQPLARATDDTVDVVRQRARRSLRTQLLRVQRATSRTSHDSGVVVGCTRDSLHAQPLARATDDTVDVVRQRARRSLHAQELHARADPRPRPRRPRPRRRRHPRRPRPRRRRHPRHTRPPRQPATRSRAPTAPGTGSTSRGSPSPARSAPRR